MSLEGKKGPDAAHTRVHRFFEMISVEEKVLQKNIEDFDGLVRMFVHPDFKDYSGFRRIAEKATDVERLRKIERRFQKILATQSDKVPPLFVLESAANTEEFLQKEARLNRMASRNVYVIRTEFANPTPLSPDKEEKYTWGLFKFKEVPTAEERIQMWDWLAHELKGLGVKKILIGGVELYVSKQDGGVSGCLGKTIEELKDHFTVEVSDLAWPDRGKELRRANLAT